VPEIRALLRGRCVTAWLDLAPEAAAARLGAEGGGRPLLAGDAPAELEAILQRLVRMDEAELREEERKVFERFRFSLCPACRLGLRARLWALSRGEAAPPGPEEPVQ